MFEFDAHEVELVAELCRAFDVLEGLEDVVRRDGLLAADGRVAPAVVEARQQRLLVTKLVGALRLPDESGEALSPKSARAKRAAESRWNRERRRASRDAAS